MWQVSNQTLTMCEGDFGLQLPVTITGTQFAAADTVRISIKDRMNGTVILEKEFTDIQQNSFIFELTEEESALFGVGEYVYALDWYHSGAFMCNIIRSAVFKVVDKA